MKKNIIDLVKNLAIENEGVDGRFKLAAAIVRRNKIVAVGLNSLKSHPMMAKFGKNEESIFLHAEIDAIKNALRQLSIDDLTSCDLLVIRVKRPNSSSKKYVLGNSFPCSGCQHAIESFGLKSVWYSTDEQTIEKMDL